MMRTIKVTRTIRAMVCASVVALVAFSTACGSPEPSAEPAVDAPIPERPDNDLPNPYATIANHFTLPEERTWGSTSAVDISPDGRFIWVAERCGANTCFDREAGEMSDVPVILKFDLDGNLVTSFGVGLLVFPHGIHVDGQGNVWVTDGQDNTAPSTPPQPNSEATIGHQVFKFSPEGELLLTVGAPGGAAAPDYFFQPNDVITNDAGEIFVAFGHSSAPGAPAGIHKLSPTGDLLMTIGARGTGPGEFDQPHGLAFDSQGRLFVADRSNSRVQILDPEGRFVAEWKQFGRPSGIYIDQDDVLYVADSESQSTNESGYGYNPGVQRGMRIGSARDGRVSYFIPDPDPRGATSAAEGAAADPDGNIYGAEVGPRGVKKYVKQERGVPGL